MLSILVNKMIFAVHSVRKCVAVCETTKSIEVENSDGTTEWVSFFDCIAF